MRAPSLSPWEWLECLGILSGLVMLAAGQILDHDALAWAALAALSLGYAGRVAVLRRDARENPPSAPQLDREALQGCAIFCIVVVVALSVVAGLIGLLVALLSGTPALDGLWTGARSVLVLAAGVALLLAVERVLARWPRAR